MNYTLVTAVADVLDYCTGLVSYAVSRQILLHEVNWCYGSLMVQLHCEPKKTPEFFFIYSLQNLTNCDKIRYILS